MAGALRKNVLPALSNFSGMKTYHILGKIEEIDARSKGVGGRSVSDGDLLKELLTFIFS